LSQRQYIRFEKVRPKQVVRWFLTIEQVPHDIIQLFESASSRAQCMQLKLQYLLFRCALVAQKIGAPNILWTIPYHTQDIRHTHYPIIPLNILTAFDYRCTSTQNHTTMYVLVRNTETSMYDQFIDHDSVMRQLGKSNNSDSLWIPSDVTVIHLCVPEYLLSYVTIQRVIDHRGCVSYSQYTPKYNEAEYPFPEKSKSSEQVRLVDFLRDYSPIVKKKKRLVLCAPLSSQYENELVNKWFSTVAHKELDDSQWNTASRGDIRALNDSHSSYSINDTTLIQSLVWICRNPEHQNSIQKCGECFSCKEWK